MQNEERNKFICEDYKAGTEINELARAYGVSERRVAQILMENNVPRRPRSPNGKKALSRQHTILGVRLYTRRFELGSEVHEAANDLGWSAIKLRKVEQGTTNVELLDLLDISAYTGLTIQELLEEPNG